MDVVSPCIAPVCKELLGWAFPKLRNMWDLRLNINEFPERKNALKDRGEDAQKSIESLRRNGKQVPNNAESWLRDCKNIDTRCAELQNQFPEHETRINYFSCTVYNFCQEVAEMMNKMNRHFDQIPEYLLEPNEQLPPNVEIEIIEYKDGLPSIERSKKAVYEALKDEKVNVIGLWGMGGIGKTTLITNISNEMANRSDFKYVIKVIVSGNLDVAKIQDQIIRRLPNMKLTDSADIQPSAARAHVISERLKELGSILIVFDDVWEPLDFSEIGILENKLCKIVLTTRNKTVCERMSVKEIKMDALDVNESWNLFQSIIVGKNKVKPKIKNTAHDVCKECAGLPLAISVVAKSLQTETDILSWSRALKFLKNANPQGVQNLGQKVYNPIRLSYDRLERNDLKDCFLLCSLFPEDHKIQLFDLICYGIGEGKPWAMDNTGIDSFDTFLDSFKQLKNRGLLQHSSRLVDYTRMHDIVRDVAINIAKEKGFFIKTGLGWTDWPQFKEEEDLKGMEWISLMENSLKDIQGIKFLSLIKGNVELKSIRSDFFEEMQNLLLLDLRETSISELTQGIQKLKKLRVLMCGLGHFSSIKISIPIKEWATLKNLLVLCLRNSHILELNEEFGTLVHLRVIDFSETRIDIIKPNVFSRLEKLEVLYMNGSFHHWKASHEKEGDCVSFVELANLENLYALEVDIEDDTIFSNQYGSVKYFPSVKLFSIRSIFDNMYGHRIFNFDLNSLVLRQNTLNIAKWLKILLEKTSRLEMSVHCKDSVDALIEPDTVKDIHNLEVLRLHKGSNYKNVIKYTSNTESDEQPILPNLEEITIININSLDTIIATHSLLPHGSFQGLVEITISHCNDMRFAFAWSMAQCLLQLRHLNIQECAKLKHIIGNDGYNTFDHLTIGQELFSKLENMYLINLPKLKSMWQQEESQENIKVQWPSMKVLMVVNCQNLKRFVFGKQSAPALERIIGDRKWFEDLIWEDEETENKFKSLFEERGI